MSNASWDKSARLFRFDGPPGSGLPQQRQEPIIVSTLGNVLRVLLATSKDDWWRFAIAVDDEPDISDAALREMLSRDDIPAADFGER
ncbi:hypothetical protein [Sphingomonas endolithica]|uniref:hypothetical protein n=1 Tax=Sphingomonas endolithica TaxID=2972485 RepID=UPI0021AFDB9B|nr:hypothetical protein [Sphingomonas sp. ZFBP2030]